jgi:hypothetical protein
MTKELEIGFGYPITIGAKDYTLLENCYRDWWIAIEDKVGNQIELLFIRAQWINGVLTPIET